MSETMESLSKELIVYPDCMERLKELKAFYDYKRDQDKKEPPKNSEDWKMIPTMFEVAIEIVSARIEKREAAVFPANTLIVAKQACSMLLNFSYACDLMTSGFYMFGRCPERERRFYEFSLENIISLIDEEINRVICQEPHENG